MLTPLLFLVSLSTLAVAQCPCYPVNGDNVYCNSTTLTSIPDCVASDVTSLHVRTPSIPLEAATFERFTALTWLSIDNFETPVIAKDMLKYLGYLQTFAIYHTDIDYIDNEWFMFSPRITRLLLYNNRLTYLAPDTFRSRSKLSPRVGMSIYISLLRPILEYASPAWASASERLIEKIFVLERRCLRKALHLPPRTSNAVVRDLAGIDNLWERILQASVRFYERAHDSNNELVSSLGRYDPEKKVNRNRPLSIFLYLPLLETVELDSNQMMSLTPALFQGTSVTTLWLYGNPWHCDCELATFVLWTQETGVWIADYAQCAHPDDLQGLNIKDLTTSLACN